MVYFYAPGRVARWHGWRVQISTRSFKVKNARKIVRTVAVVSIIGAGLALAACETTKGVGKDIQYGAQKTQDALDGKK